MVRQKNPKPRQIPPSDETSATTPQEMSTFMANVHDKNVKFVARLFRICFQLMVICKRPAVKKNARKSHEIKHYAKHIFKAVFDAAGIRVSALATANETERMVDSHYQKTGFYTSGDISNSFLIFFERTNASEIEIDKANDYLTKVRRIAGSKKFK